MSRIILISLIALTACDRGTKWFWGLPAQRVTVNTMTFDVRVGPIYVETLRQNFIAIARLSDIAPNAQIAAEQVTGCSKLTLSPASDPSVQYFKIDC